MNVNRALIHLVVAVAAAAPAAAQSETVLLEDFESGLGAWTIDPPTALPAFHAAPDGECGAVTTMAACNSGAPSCDHTFVGATKTGRQLVSPSFQLGNYGPWVFEFDYRKSMDASDKAGAEFLSGSGDGISFALAQSLPDSAGVTHVSVTKDLDEWWWGQGVTIEFGMLLDPPGNTGFGFMIDNVRVTNLLTWPDVGEAKAGSAGTPVLEGHGSLAPGSDNTLALANAAPSSMTTLVAGITDLYAAFKGGTMVPQPLVLLPLPSSPTGEVLLPFVMPPGAPGNTNLYLQFWIQDAGASHGFSASNGLAAFFD